MGFAAKYAGRCASDDCLYGDNRIREGDDVEYVDDELQHQECANVGRRGGPPLCGQCFTYHRGDCL
jgi:hypothetical protein